MEPGVGEEVKTGKMGWESEEATRKDESKETEEENERGETRKG